MHTRSEWKQISKEHIAVLRQGTPHFESYGAAIFSISGANGIRLSELGIDAGELSYLMQDNAVALVKQHVAALRRNTNSSFASYIAAIHQVSSKYRFTLESASTSRDELDSLATQHATEIAREHVQVLKNSPAFAATFRDSILELIRMYKVTPASIGFDVSMMAN